MAPFKTMLPLHGDAIFYVYGQVKHKQFDVRWHHGQENLGDYARKYHLPRLHMQVHPIYLQMKSFPIFPQREMKPSNMRGCVGKVAGEYIRWRPLPPIPILVFHVPRVHQAT